MQSIRRRQASPRVPVAPSMSSVGIIYSRCQGKAQCVAAGHTSPVLTHLLGHTLAECSILLVEVEHHGVLQVQRCQLIAGQSPTPSLGTLVGRRLHQTPAICYIRRTTVRSARDRYVPSAQVAARGTPPAIVDRQR